MAADISSTGKDNLGKTVTKRRFLAHPMGIPRFLPV
jgi:hypothetical protein